MHAKNIQADSLVTDIVTQDYRTSSVFRKHGINYCCGGKRPLNTVCETLGLNTELVKRELLESMRVLHISSSTGFKNWRLDFLIDYIMNVHHSYIVAHLPEIIKTVEHFEASHKSKYPYATDLLTTLRDLEEEIIPHIEHENQVIFPYIKQMLHTYENRETDASLLVQALCNPIERIIRPEHRHIEKYMQQLRESTSDYTAPSNACITHRVAFSQLKELEQDLMQYTHLEINILFPKAITLERALLQA